MEITKYTYQGKDTQHDIGFTEDNKFLRFGSDDDPKPGFKQAFRTLCAAASEIAGFTIEIRRIVWKREPKEVTAVIEGLAMAKTGELMKVKLPAMGWRKVLTEKIPGTLEEEIRPVGTDTDGVEALLSFEVELMDYVRTGSGQLDLFAIPADIVRSVADRILSFKA